MIRRALCLLLLLSACGSGGTEEPAGAPDAPEAPSACARFENPAADAPVVTWPSADLVSLQELIDQAAPGTTISIQPGVYDIPDPLVLDHKVDLILQGGGADVDDPLTLTQLDGGVPLPVSVEWDPGGVDNVVSPAADDVLGMFTCRGSSVSIRSLRMTGWDAGIVTRDLDGTPSSLCARDLMIAGTGRGVLLLGTGDVSLSDCEIVDTAWNAISVAPRFTGPVTSLPVIDVSRASLVEPLGVGIYCAGPYARVSHATITRAANGGIVTVGCRNLVTDCTIVNCAKAGVLLYEAWGASRVDRCWIVGTRSFPGPILGDGIAMFLSDAQLDGNTINGPARAGISLFGGTAWLRDNTITCASFSLFSDAFDGRAGVLDDGGGNLCGCGSGLSDCDRTGAGAEPPAPVGGLE